MTDVQKIISHGIVWDDNAFDEACNMGVVESINGKLAEILNGLTDDNIKNLCEEIIAVNDGFTTVRFLIYLESALYFDEFLTDGGLHISSTVF